MYKVVKFKKQERYINDFLSLPSKLYDKKTITQNKKDEIKILNGTHSLSKYFDVIKYLCYDEEQNVIARAIVTIYPDKKKKEAYVGFFESYDNLQAVKKLFTTIEKDLKKLSIKKLIGPVNSSFWIGYRMKVDNFNEELYVGEPYNKDYYYKLFKECGFKTYKKYSSNIYEIKSKDYNPEKYEQRYNEFIEKGYVIKSPKNKKEFDVAFKIVYDLLMELYKDFPIFKNISSKDYEKYYSFYSVIANYKLLKLAYYKDEAVGFFVGIPNYRNLMYQKMNLVTKIKFLYLKYFNKSFVAQYIGVKPEHKGLGKAIIYTILQEAKKCNGKIIGSLIEENKVTGKYFDDTITSKYNYLLLEKKIGE